jgi:hypothetical protein
MLGRSLEHSPLESVVSLFLFPLCLFPLGLQLIFKVFPNLIKVVVDLMEFATASSAYKASVPSNGQFRPAYLIDVPDGLETLFLESRLRLVEG